MITLVSMRIFIILAQPFLTDFGAGNFCTSYNAAQGFKRGFLFILDISKDATSLPFLVIMISSMAACSIYLPMFILNSVAETRILFSP